MSSQRLNNLKPYGEVISMKSVQLQKKTSERKAVENNHSHFIFTHLFQVTINIDFKQLNFQLKSELNKGT